MKNGFKYCALALAITSILTGCNDNNDDSNNNGNAYAVPIASNIAMSGDRFVNSTLTGEYTFIDPNYSPRPEGTSDYEWRLDDGDQIISNDAVIGQKRTLILTSSEEDKLVYFCVTPKAKGTTDNLTGKIKCSTSTQITAGDGNKPEANNASINNTSPMVSDQLTGNYDYSDQDGDPEGVSTFRWLADSSNIANATEKSLILTNQQESKLIQFCVTPVSTNPENKPNSPLIGDETCSIVTDAVDPLAGDAPTATKPVITGNHVVGSTLSADYTYADIDADLEATSEFVWQRDGSDITGATSKTYTLQAEDEAKSITFVVTPIAATGTPTTGNPVSSDPITDVTAPVGPIPSITLNPVSKSDSDYPKIGDVLTGSYQYTASSTGSADNSTAVWKANSVAINGADCSTASSCDLTLTNAELGKTLTYCVTPKAIDSPAGTETCSPVEKAYGIALTGTLEFGKTLNLAVYGYDNPTIEWQVDVSNIQGPAGDSNRTTRNSVTNGEIAKTFLIGDEVLKQIINTDQSSLLDLDDAIGNKNGIVDDADWAQASLAGNVTMDSGDANTINAAHYVGKDIAVTITFTEAGVDPVTLIASETPAVNGGVYYDKADVSKRGIEPVRELTFGTVVYHRPITEAEVVHNAAIGFGAAVAYPRYTKPATGINWALYRAKKDPNDTQDKYKSDFPAVDSCLNLYDGENDLWHLPVSRSDGSYIANGYAAQGNNPPMADADKPYTLIKLAGAINKNDNSPKTGLLGTYIDRSSPNPKLNYNVSPTTGRVLNGDTGSTAHWSATTSGSNTNSVLFYEAGGSGNNAPTNGRFVSCVRAK